MSARKVFVIWSSKKWNRKRMKFVRMWFWHLKSVSNLGEEIVAQGETNGYFNLSDCKNGVAFVQKSMHAEIIIHDGSERVA